MDDWSVGLEVEQWMDGQAKEETQRNTFEKVKSVKVADGEKILVGGTMVKCMRRNPLYIRLVTEAAVVWERKWIKLRVDENHRK